MAVTMTITTGDDISYPLAAYSNSRIMMKLPDALSGGTETMRLAGTEYLPQEAGESDEKYQIRLKRSVLLEVYSRTIEKMVGEMFKTKIAISDDVDEDVKNWLNDIDRQGNDITVFMSKIAATAIDEGISHILVEYPRSPGKTLADHKAAGAQPYFVHIKPASVIGWRFDDSLKTGKKLMQLRIKEAHTASDGLYGQKEVERIRLLTPGAWAVYEEKEGSWTIATDDDGQLMEGRTNLDYIPLITFWFGEEVSELTARPPLMPLAHLNCTHWQSSSDQRNILHYARLVTWFGKMLEEDEGGQILIGANRLVKSNSEGGDLKIVEHSGAAIGAGRQDLEDLKTEMALFGLSLLISKTGTVTATEKGIDKGESDSAIHRWARIVNSGMEQAFRYMHKYLGKEVKGTITANDDFSGALNDQDSALLVKAFESGLLPRSIVVDELKSRGVIKGEIDLIDLVAQLAEDQKATASQTPLSGTLSANPLASLQM